MKAKDPFGNTRWKGAFTGGFEAGYKNTCGSKDGWAPSTFISSVYKRAQKTQRNIFDYMDKEDLGRESISNNISLTNNFQNIKNDTLNVSLHQSIGEKILSKLKKLGAHQNAPQNEQQLQQLFKIYEKVEEVAKPTYQLTDLTQPITVGAIASHLSNDDFIDAYEDFYRKVIREHTRQQTEQEISKRRQQNRIYFDFTKPLEQEPEYLREIQEVEMNQQPRKRKKNLINQQSLKSLYAPAVLFKQFSKTQQIEKAPQQYDPYWKVRQYHQKTTHKDISHTGFVKPLTAEKRGQMLGEIKLSNKFVTSQNSLANRFISKQAKQTNLAVFFEDQKKNRRFHEYMEQMEGKKISSQLEYLSYEAAEKERNEFQTVYKTHREEKAKPENKNKKEAHKQSQQKIKQFKIARRIQSWRPQKLLCKRFNVMTPYVVPKQANKQLFYA